MKFKISVTKNGESTETIKLDERKEMMNKLFIGECKIQIEDMIDKNINHIIVDLHIDGMVIDRIVILRGKVI